MRTAVSLLIVLLSFSCRLPQTLHGDYIESYGKGWGGAAWHFNNDGTFSVRQQFDIGAFYGKGTYHVWKDSISFVFADDTLYTDSPPPGYWVSNDSINERNEIEINVTDDSTKDTLFGATVAAFDSNSVLISVATVNLDGNCIIALKEYTGVFALKAVCPGYENAVVLFPKPLCSGFHMCLKPSIGHRIEPKTEWKFSTRKSRRKIIFTSRNSDTLVVGTKLKIKTWHHKSVLRPITYF
jgi:hypothetical protein